MDYPALVLGFWLGLTWIGHDQEQDWGGTRRHDGPTGLIGHHPEDAFTGYHLLGEIREPYPALGLSIFSPYVCTNRLTKHLRLTMMIMSRMRILSSCVLLLP